MMFFKKYYYYIFCLFIIFGSVSIAAAQMMDDPQDFQNSLTSIEENAQEIFNENIKIRSQNQILLKNFEDMKIIIESYKKENQRLASPSPEIMAQSNQKVDLLKEEVMRAQDEIATLLKEQETILQKYKNRQNEELKIKQRIDEVKEVIQTLKKDLESISAGTYKKKYQEQKKELSRSIRNAKKSVLQQQKEFDQYSRKYKGLSKELEKVEKQNNELKERIEQSAVKKNDSGSTQEKYEKEIVFIMQNAKKESKDLLKQISDLSQRKQELNQILLKVQSKIGSDRSNLGFDLEAENYLKKNLSTMRSENEALKQQLHQVQVQLRKIKNK